MEWNIIINDEHKYIEVITRGIADKESSLSMVKAVINEVEARNIKKVLFNHRNLENVIGSVLDIYQRPQELKESGLKFNGKTALIIKPEHWEHYRFLETVCKNQGILVSIFQDKEEAISWLLK